MLVRLKPYNKHLGWVKRTHTSMIKGRFMKFVGARGWYQVSKEVAELLRRVPQEDRKPNGEKAFFVAESKDEARMIEERIKEQTRRKVDNSVGTADAPVSFHRPGRTRVTEPAKEGDDASSSDESNPSKRRGRTRATVASKGGDGDDE